MEKMSQYEKESKRKVYNDSNKLLYDAIDEWATAILLSTYLISGSRPTLPISKTLFSDILQDLSVSVSYTNLSQASRHDEHLCMQAQQTLSPLTGMLRKNQIAVSVSNF